MCILAGKSFLISAISSTFHNTVSVDFYGTAQIVCRMRNCDGSTGKLRGSSIARLGGKQKLRCTVEVSPVGEKQCTSTGYCTYQLCRWRLRCTLLLLWRTKLCQHVYALPQPQGALCSFVPKKKVYSPQVFRGGSPLFARLTYHIT